MKIEEAIGYHFSDKQLLERALTRKAYALEQKQQNIECEDQEVFRTLGDAVLKTVLVDLLIKAGYKTREDITNNKKGLEREETLAQINHDLGIGPHIRLGIGEQKQNAHEEPKVLAETLEALIGGIYYDGGYDTSKEVITQWFKTKI